MFDSFISESETFVFKWKIKKKGGVKMSRPWYLTPPPPLNYDKTTLYSFELECYVALSKSEIFVFN